MSRPSINELLSDMNPTTYELCVVDWEEWEKAQREWQARQALYNSLDINLEIFELAA